MARTSAPFLIRAMRRTESGSALVELAVALPLLVLLAIGAADFGRVFYTGIAVANAARAAAEFGAAEVQNFQDTSIVNQVGRDEAAEIAPVLVTSEQFCRCPDGTTPACDGSCPEPFTWTEVFVKAYAQKTITLLMPYPGLPQTLTFRDSAVFRAQ